MKKKAIHLKQPANKTAISQWPLLLWITLSRWRGRYMYIHQKMNISPIYTSILKDLNILNYQHLGWNCHYSSLFLERYSQILRQILDQDRKQGLFVTLKTNFKVLSPHVVLQGCKSQRSKVNFTYPSIHSHRGSPWDFPPNCWTMPLCIHINVIVFINSSGMFLLVCIVTSQKSN